MDQSAITVRYAKAFFILAKERNILEKLKSDIQLILGVCSDSKEFILLLESPIVAPSKKMGLMDEIFKGKIDVLTWKFLQLIAKNKREVNIPGICRNFLDLTRKDQNIKSAVLITATKLEKDSIDSIGVLIEKQLKTKIELSSEVDADIIGGIVLRLEDKQYDASVATQLKRIKEQLLMTELK